MLPVNGSRPAPSTPPPFRPPPHQVKEARAALLAKKTRRDSALDEAAAGGVGAGAGAGGEAAVTAAAAAAAQRRARQAAFRAGRAAWVAHIQALVAAGHGNPRKWMRDEVRRRHEKRLLRQLVRGEAVVGGGAVLSLVSKCAEPRMPAQLAEPLLRPPHRPDPYVFWLEETTTRLASAAALAEVAVVTAQEEARLAAALADAATANLAVVVRHTNAMRVATAALGAEAARAAARLAAATASMTSLRAAAAAAVLGKARARGALVETREACRSHACDVVHEGAAQLAPTHELLPRLHALLFRTMALELVAQAEGVALERRLQQVSLRGHGVAVELADRRRRRANVTAAWRRRVMLACPRSELAAAGLMARSRRGVLAGAWAAWRDFNTWSAQVRALYTAGFEIEKAERDLAGLGAGANLLPPAPPVSRTAMQRLQLARWDAAAGKAAPAAAAAAAGAAAGGAGAGSATAGGSS